MRQKERPKRYTEQPDSPASHAVLHGVAHRFFSLSWRGLIAFACGALACLLASLLVPGNLPGSETNLASQYPLWPASGVALGFAWLYGWRWLAPVAAGAAVWVAMSTGNTMLVGAAFLTTTAGPLAALCLLNWLNVWKPTESRQESALRMLVAVVLLSAPLNAVILTSGLYVDPLASQPRLLTVLGGWWLLDALGTLLFAPCVVAAVRGSIGMSGQLNNATDPWLDSGAMVMTAALVLGGLLASEVGRQPYAYTLIYFFIPVAAWIAIRRSEKTLAFTLLAGTSLVFVGRSIQLATGETAGPAFIEASLILFVAVLIAILLQAVASDRRMAMERVRQQARQDMSTGLLNDRGLMTDVKKALESSNRSHYGLLGLHVTNFDGVSDLCGPLAALELERSIAHTLNRHPGKLAAARLSAGRYALLIRTDALADVRDAARQLYAIFNGQLLRSENGLIRLRPAVGGLLIDRQASTTSEDCLLSLAEVQAIANGAHDPRLFVEALAQASIDARRRGQARIEQIREAIRERRFEIHAQPIYDADSNSGQLSYEILIRLIDRDGSLIQPNDFLSLAAQARLTPTLDRGVISRVFAWLARNPQAHQHTAKCSINLSGLTMSDGLIADFIRTERQQAGIDPSRIVFEITESEAIRSPATAIRLVQALKADGFGIALDDFGVGLATFEYLKRFPLDYLKIDGSFIRNLPNNPIDDEIVRAIVRVARQLQIETVAEHVQSREVYEHLEAIGVRHFQGDLIGQVVPLRDLFTQPVEYRRSVV